MGSVSTVKELKVRRGNEARNTVRQARQQNIFFYRNAYRNTIKVLQVVLVILLVVTGFIAYIIVTEPEPDYYATSNAGALTALTGYPDAKTAKAIKLNRHNQ